MLERILVAGSGGQGVILTGKLMATVAVNHVPHVTFFPAYGAEVRGGTSNCQVILSSREIASPVAEEFDSMIIMNQASGERFLPLLVRGGVAALNSSLCSIPPTGSMTAVDATDEAGRLGDTRVANLILLGALLGRKPILPPEGVETAIEQILAGKSRELVTLNVSAFRSGLRHSTGTD
jgi:2-oxoglutarate ferredoxin oxidoreductase subunit gamma